MNYEALGRYTAANEQAHKLATQRDAKLSELAKTCSMITGSKSSAYLAVSLDIEVLYTLLSDIEKLDADLCEAIAAANAVAIDCDKRPLSLWRKK